MTLTKSTLFSLVMASMLWHGTAMGDEENLSRIANRSLSKVSECVPGRQGSWRIENAFLELTYQNVYLDLNLRPISDAAAYGQSLFIGKAIQDVDKHSTVEIEKFRFQQIREKTAMEICREVRAKVIGLFNIKQ